MPPENPRNLFRKEALIHLTVPEQLNHAIVITGSKSWILLSSLSLLALGIVLWSLFGAISTRVDGQGIILANNEGIYNAAAPAGEGYISSLQVKLGDSVQQGQLLAKLNNPSLKEQIETQQKMLTLIEQKYQNLLKESEIAIRNRHLQVIKQNDYLRNVIKQQSENLIYAKDLLEIRKEAFKKGLITKQEVVASWQQFYDTKKNIETTKKELLQNDIYEKSYHEEWEEKLRNLDLKIKDQKQELDVLKGQYNTGQYVYSPVNGTITNIQVQLGDMVKDGMPIMSIAPAPDNLEVIAYVPAEQGKKITAGMKALIVPSVIKKEEYGSMLGKVSYVSPYPSNSDSMKAVLKNTELVQHLSEKNLPIEIRILLQKDASTASGFQWTSASGPPQAITAGTMVEINIIVRKQAPVTLLLPGLKKLFGSD
ncbi:Colicin V secretion protein CvaA [Legionella birminghamensis]|uniref:Colicin V secretion protein CvaA n=1 Tax=Legionella birminghamensis TaxID=28083 RepID=A0A378IF65_9GAMM|nr:NHLP bacteriocin system secretion protein [Legionella birminghamensis]KTC71518.1 Colicin V secretion protein CvaA [Legionella birminghamensis]STX30874.1 Colicin V secretion protein CvaA [Legionella birminghamensis]